MLLFIALFSLLSFIISLVFFISLKANLMQLNSLLKSSYQYSAIVDEIKEINTYFRYNIGIDYAVNPDLKVGINAESIMQTLGAYYTNAVYWNAKNLKEHEVAISKGISQIYNLKEGEHIYSKSVVDGKVHEYLIAQILPNVTTSRMQKEHNYTDGIIIMGYDSKYVDNVSHKILLFSNGNVNSLLGNNEKNVTNIIYREDEISIVCKEIVLYCILLVILIILITIGFVETIKENIKYNFKRLVMLGFNDNILSKTFDAFILGNGTVFIIASSIMLLLVLHNIELNTVVLAFFISIVFIESITLFVSSHIMKRKFWR